MASSSFSWQKGLTERAIGKAVGVSCAVCSAAVVIGFQTIQEQEAAPKQMYKVQCNIDHHEIELKTKHAIV